METSTKNNTFQLTTHSALRAQQRGICATDISFVLEHSKPLYKQGMEFFSLINIRKNKRLYLSKKSELVQMIVLTRHDERYVITVYKKHEILEASKTKK